MSARPERLGDVLCQCADIRTLGAQRLELQVRGGRCQQGERENLNISGGPLYFDSGARQLVERLTVSLQSRIHGRNLRLRTVEPAEYLIEERRVEGGYRRRLNDGSFRIPGCGS